MSYLISCNYDSRSWSQLHNSCTEVSKRVDSVSIPVNTGKMKTYVSQQLTEVVKMFWRRGRDSNSW